MFSAMFMDGDPIIWVQQCAIYYTYLYLFYAGINDVGNATQMTKVLLSRTLGMSTLTIFYSLQNIRLSLLIGLDT